MTPEWEALIVGINRYPEYTNFNDLTVAALDGENVAQQLDHYGYEPFRIQDLPLGLTQKEPEELSSRGIVKLEELRSAVANLFNPPAPNQAPETALFFFSGHGCRQEVDGIEEVFLVTSDAFPDVGIYGYSLRELGEQIATSSVKQVVIWLDCCYSGELLNFIPTDKAYCLITATRSFEPGVEISHEQGVFTKALLAGLNPENHPDGIVNSHNLAEFIEKRMSMTSQRPLIANSNQAILLTTKFTKSSFQDKCPYRSLSYFTAKVEDALVFHGRSKLTQQLIERVKTKDRLLLVLGASGSGKSSLVRAGLLYQLKLGQVIVGSDRWYYLEPFTPGEAPKQRLQEVLENGEGEQKQSENSSVTPVVIIIDQFEECFTMSQPDQRQEFFNSLIELIENTNNLIVLIAMRSDFRGRLREYAQFVEKINKPYINVDHLNREEIEEAIAKPAELVGLGIEGRLKQQLINDVEDYPGSLPLLQYTLTELWKQSRHQQETFLRLKTYQQLGGIEGTLEKRANQVFDSLSPEEQNVARRLLLELTQVGDTLDTRRRIRLGELVNSHHSLELLDAVSQKLASSDNRLITRSHEENSQDVVLDVVHEALIGHWGKLVEWKQTYTETMVIERKLEAAALEWQQKGKKRDDVGLLLLGGRLVEAQEYLNEYGKLGMLNGLAEEYIQVSGHKHKQMTRNGSLRVGAVIAVLVLGTVASTVLWLESREQLRKATRSEIEILSELSQNLSNSKRPFDVLKRNLKAAGKLKKANWVKADTRIKLSASLGQSLYGVKEFNSLEKHTAPVQSVAFSYDGKTIASGSWDKTVKLWNHEGKLLRTLTGHSKTVSSVAFSPDGKTIASGSWDKTVKLWNLEGQELLTLTGHSNSVISVAFSYDGQTIASSSRDNTVKLWNHEGKLLHTLTGHSETISSVAFSPDGKTIASGSWDKTVKLWNHKGKLLRTLTGHSETISSVAFSPDGKTIASGSWDNTVKLWNLEGQELLTLTGHSNSVISVAFSYDGQTIASASTDNTVKLWNLEGQELLTLKGHTHWITSVAFSPDRKSIASASWDNTVKLWNLEGQELNTLTGHSAPVNSVAFSPDGQTIATASGDSTLKFWNHEGKILQTLTGHRDEVNSVAFSYDGQTIATASQDKTVKLWNREGKELLTLTGHSEPVTSVAFSYDGQTIASASWDKTVKLWNREGKELHTLIGHSNYVRSVAFSPDGQTIASGGYDTTMKLWNLEGKLLQTLTVDKNWVYSIAFSPDGQTMAFATGQNTVKLLNLESQLLQTLTGHRAAVNSVAFSYDGQTIASASHDNTVKLWNLEGKLLHTLTGHRDGVNSVAFSYDGQTIATASSDKTVILWNFDLEDLVTKSCNWLHDYLVTHQDQEKELREICGM
ncbi:MAG: NACHT domain-containing protein [Moorea sp. SIO1F2]|uniref:nSTAND1 domain-containing NTPase n=1 Tax=Moorena sp. SIO1F2 TaxID=2607819 RepID=UPI0013B6590B|nr:caspase family protein [Moorena sp. SIO1F2]NET82152.1 NACHT domain-containing protein [Moorena sp. SIO1F2]